MSSRPRVTRERATRPGLPALRLPAPPARRRSRTTRHRGRHPRSRPRGHRLSGVGRPAQHADRLPAPLNFHDLSGLQATERNLHRCTDRFGARAGFPGLDEGDRGKARAYCTHYRGAGDEEPAPFRVHAISWHSFLQMDWNPMGPVLLECSRARMSSRQRRLSGRRNRNKPPVVVKQAFYPKRGILNNA